MEKARGFPKRTANPLYQEIQVGVSHLPWVLETDLVTGPQTLVDPQILV